jgi:YesN/AraC family two-component response regulator
MTCSISAITLLLAEDNKEVSEITGRMIARTFPEITIYFAGNGRIGVELFKEHEADIVITDIDMPVMDGIQMTGEIKAIKADTKFIVLTGYSDKNRLEKFSEIGVNNYIPKPIMFEKLFAAIEKCIAEIMLQRHKSN